ncbi:hypothetical protein KZZ52_45335 [Dactylosporangium sp. AC04546]|uniref:hypothetical protein n=1 Tax=Dactylosporangium sp. AC04546 TaxID=2862460 RepID=UPI001EDE4988|nr:hypothetical protein [Dactylosporangium sp. AC04546]WVK81140.1 hypothetical protein KZZ52_45335 [Dactylosporangium sp. AC04546]
MTNPGPHVHRLARRGLFATDIEAYGRRTGPDQYAAQRVYELALQRAAERAGLPLARCRRQPAGDGELLVLPGGVHEPRVIAALLPSLAAQLDRYNEQRCRRRRVRLRAAVHHGLIQLDGPTGFPGRPLVVLARLLDCGPLRAVLREHPQVSLAAIISADVYEEVVANRYGGLRPGLFRPTAVDLPGYERAGRAWVCAPGHDLGRSAA